MVRPEQEPSWWRRNREDINGFGLFALGGAVVGGGIAGFAQRNDDDVLRAAQAARSTAVVRMHEAQANTDDLLASLTPGCRQSLASYAPGGSRERMPDEAAQILVDRAGTCTGNASAVLAYRGVLSEQAQTKLEVTQSEADLQKAQESADSFIKPILQGAGAGAIAVPAITVVLFS